MKIVNFSTILGRYVFENQYLVYVLHVLTIFTAYYMAHYIIRRVYKSMLYTYILLVNFDFKF